MAESGRGDEVLSIGAAPDGAVWLAIDKGGIVYYDGEGWAHNTADDGLPHRLISSVAFAPDGTLWIGGRDGGICHCLGPE